VSIYDTVVLGRNKMNLMFPSASPWHILDKWTLTPRQVYTPLAGAFYLRPANPFFLRSTHRFFISKDNRLRPAALIPWLFRGDDAPLPEVSVVAIVARWYLLHPALL